MAQYEKYAITAQRLSGIADAIREKNGSSDTYTPSEMADAILAIEAGTSKMFSSVATGVIPTLYKGTASSVFDCTGLFETTATGVLINS